MYKIVYVTYDGSNLGEIYFIAAWLRFPNVTIEPLEQLYRRASASTYRYESAGGRFTRELQVDKAGFVIRYPDLWEIENSA